MTTASKIRSASACRRGFTLTEMLVVVGVIVLIVTLAVPAFNAISGNRSIDAAQNQLSAIIGRARQEAIGLQDYRGVLMFQDVNTGRACAVEVYYPRLVPNDPNRIETAPTHDELLLPTGISFRMIEIAGTAGVLYSPMNVVMFNARGEFVDQPWSIATLATPGGPNTLGARIGSLPTFVSTNMPATRVVKGAARPEANGDWTSPNVDTTSSPGGPSAFGFILFPDEGAYQNAFANGTTSYITDNGISFLINKYNGTLLRSE